MTKCVFMLYVDHINLLLFIFQTNPDTILSPQDNIEQEEISVLVIRRKDHGLTDIVSNEGRRPEFDTISVRL